MFSPCWFPLRHRSASPNCISGSLSSIASSVRWMTSVLTLGLRRFFVGSGRRLSSLCKYSRCVVFHSCVWWPSLDEISFNRLKLSKALVYVWKISDSLFLQYCRWRWLPVVGISFPVDSGVKVTCLIQRRLFNRWRWWWLLSPVEMQFAIPGGGFKLVAVGMTIFRHVFLGCLALTTW